jgi:hypothetical protein
VSATAIRSRWKCIAAFGRPVVPEVNAMIATSSAAVWTDGNEVGLPAAIAVTSSGPDPPNSRTVRPGTLAAVSSAVNL